MPIVRFLRGPGRRQYGPRPFGPQLFVFPFKGTHCGFCDVEAFPQSIERTLGQIRCRGVRVSVLRIGLVVVDNGFHAHRY
jgi:hypothetical protein